MTPVKPTRDSLNDVMEFDRVIQVHPDGTVSDMPGESAPDLFDDIVSPGWSLMTGYSGQSGYAGPIMHNSEYIGGRMADDILSTPGIYVAVVSYLSIPDAESTGDDDTDDHGIITEGWAVAFKAPPVHILSATAIIDHDKVTRHLTHCGEKFVYGEQRESYVVGNYAGSRGATCKPCVEDYDNRYGPGKWRG